MSPIKCEEALNDCREMSKHPKFPIGEMHRSSTIAFNLDDGLCKMELLKTRNSTGSICSSNTKNTSMLSCTSIRFNKMMRRIFLISILWIASLCWDHVHNYKEQVEADPIIKWKRKIFPFMS